MLAPRLTMPQGGLLPKSVKPTPVVFSDQSMGRLGGVNYTLAEILKETERRALDRGIKIEVTEGLRDPGRQSELVAAGKSQTLNSRHLTGSAIDVNIVNPDGSVNWDFEAYRPVADIAKEVAAEKGIPDFVWGGDWKTLKDGVHFQVGSAGSGGAPITASTKGGAPMGLLGVPPEQDTSGLIGLLTGKQKPWAGKLNDIGAVLLALSGSPAAQPLMEQLNKRKDAKREDARLNQTAAWLASMGRDDLASAVMAGGLSGSDAASIATMTPAEAPKPIEVGGVLLDPVTLQPIFDSRTPETPEAVNLETFTGADGVVYSFNPVTSETKRLTEGDPAAAEVGFRRATPEEAATYGAANGQFGPDGRFYPVDVPQGMTVESDGQGGVRIVQGPAGSGGGLTSANVTDVNKATMAYNSVVEGLDEYERIFAETGGKVVPSAKKDSLLTARRGLQLQLKELFNLGVINGPDLAILDALLVDPTSLVNNALDAIGVASLDDRVTSNLGQVRTLLKQIIDAKVNVGDGVTPTAPASGDLGLSEDDLQYLGAP